MKIDLREFVADSLLVAGYVLVAVGLVSLAGWPGAAILGGLVFMVAGLRVATVRDPRGVLRSWPWPFGRNGA